MDFHRFYQTRRFSRFLCDTRVLHPMEVGLGRGFVANHFDVVPVRANDESRIVVRVVLWAQARRTIVFATRLQSRAIESFDLLAILGRERQVKRTPASPRFGTGTMKPHLLR